MREIHKLALDGETDKLAKLLEKFTSEIDSTDSVQKETPLILACRFGHLATAELLLNNHANPSIIAKDGYTALHAIINQLKLASSSELQENCYTIIRLLLEQDASLIDLPVYTNSQNTVFTVINDKKIKARILEIIKNINPKHHLLLTYSSIDPQTETTYTKNTPIPDSSKAENLTLRRRKTITRQPTVEVVNIAPSSSTFSWKRGIVSLFNKLVSAQENSDRKDEHTISSESKQKL